MELRITFSGRDEVLLKDLHKASGDKKPQTTLRRMLREFYNK